MPPGSMGITQEESRYLGSVIPIASAVPDMTSIRIGRGRPTDSVEETLRSIGGIFELDEGSQYPGSPLCMHTSKRIRMKKHSARLRRAVFVLSAAASVLGAQACASAGHEAVPGPSPEAGRAPDAQSSATTSTADLEAIYRARLDSALLNVHEADVHFMTGMIGHHAQALIMSGFAPNSGASASVQTLAARIINAQKDEIANMQSWLRDRDQPVPEVDERGLMVGGHQMDHAPDSPMQMPGMLTDAQLEELGKAKDGAFDRLFLTYMIQHHQGAVTMVHRLFATDGAAQDDFVFKLASDIQVDQITEVARMELMLEALP